MRIFVLLMLCIETCQENILTEARDKCCRGHHSSYNGTICVRQLYLIAHVKQCFKTWSTIFVHLRCGLCSTVLFVRHIIEYKLLLACGLIKHPTGKQYIKKLDGICTVGQNLLLNDNMTYSHNCNEGSAVRGYTAPSYIKLKLTAVQLHNGTLF